MELSMYVKKFVFEIFWKIVLLNLTKILNLKIISQNFYFEKKKDLIFIKLYDNLNK